MKVFLSKIRPIVFLLFSIPSVSFSQPDSISELTNTVHSERLALVIGVESALYGGTIWGLNELWYKDYPRSTFHYFDDNSEWLQMDKVGHLVTSYNVGKIGIDLMKWSGVEPKRAVWLGGMLGTVFLNTIEVLDGYSSGWGFSVGDFAANTIGSFFVVGQELAWEEQRMLLKYSFQQSNYSSYREELLGENLQENLLKDYNGQTYWLSLNIASFLKQDSRFPKWLNLALGYGADGMIGGKENPKLEDQYGNAIVLDRFRQYYLSLDVDLSRIKTKSKVLKTIFHSIGFVKFPAPALEFNKNGLKGNLLGF